MTFLKFNGITRNYNVATTWIFISSHWIRSSSKRAIMHFVEKRKIDKQHDLIDKIRHDFMVIATSKMYLKILINCYRFGVLVTSDPINRHRSIANKEKYRSFVNNSMLACYWMIDEFSWNFMRLKKHFYINSCVRHEFFKYFVGKCGYKNTRCVSGPFKAKFRIYLYDFATTWIKIIRLFKW